MSTVLKFTESFIKNCYVIDPEPVSDQRGSFARVYCKSEFRQIGHDKEFVQMNHSWNTKKGLIRGIHYQVPPFSEIKLIRCIRGAVYDVVVDIRKDSPTFLRHFSLEMSAQNKKMIYVPEGFAHGFQTLTDDAELLYHHTEYYRPGAECGIRYNDPLLAIKWPLEPTIISERDKTHALLDQDFKGL
jgi:dTDP-4-dehydrorhamnose 3,5-epimerase